MKQKLLNNFRLRAIMLVALLCGAFSGAWAAEEVYKTALFGSSYNSGSIGSYTATWTATNNGFTVSLENFNNNNNGWAYVKCGRKNNASVGTITTADAIDQAISKVVVTIDNITASNVNSIKLYTSSDNSTWTEAGSFTKATGAKEVTLASPAANLYYKIEFDCASGSANGLVTVSKVEYYYNPGGAASPSISADDIAIEYNATSGAIEYTINNSVDGGTLSATTEAEWLTPGTVGATVPFSCEANDGAERTATVTLTYTYNNETVTKNVIVTQAANPNGPGSENNPYTVAEARAAIDAGTGLAGVYATGIISQVDSYNSTYNSITYWISEDGTTTSDQLEVYRGKGLNNTNFTSVNDVVVGATVVVYGTLKKFNSTYEFDKNNYLTSYSAPAVAVEAPTFSPAAGTYADAQSVTISCETPDATIYYTTDGTEPTNQSTEYTGAIAVNADMTIKAIAVKGNESSTVATATYHINSAANPYTVTQALAFSEYPANGVYVSGIVSTAPTQSPTNSGQLTYYISVDGQATNQLQVYKGLGLDQAAFTAQDDIQVGDEVTIYGDVKIYNTTKEFDAGNYLVAFNRPATPTITVTSTSLTDFTYVAENGPSAAQQITIGGENLTNSWSAYLNDYGSSNFEFSFTEDGEYFSESGIGSMTDPNQNVLIYVRMKSGLPVGDYTGAITITSNGAETVTVNLSGSVIAALEAPVWSELPTDAISVGEEYVLNLADFVSGSPVPTISITTGGDIAQFEDNILSFTPTEAGSFDFTFSASNSEGSAEATLTITVIAPASIEVSETAINIPATASDTNGTISVTYNNITDQPEYFAHEQFYDADDNPLTANPASDWITVGMMQDNNIWYQINAENTSSEPRTVYFRIWAPDDNDVMISSELITITQAGVATDYAELPFEWEGGASADFLAMNGVTAYGLGSDYAASNAPYNVKLDGTGDYIQVKTNSRPDVVTVGVKMIGGDKTSTITVQESADGENFSDVEELEISGKQNDILALETTNAFAENSRYVRLLFTKGSNVGVGPISISEASNEPSITITPDTYERDAKAGGGELPVVCANLADDPQLEVIFVEADGVTPATYDWISAEINNYGNIDGQITANTGDARTAYFYVQGVDADNNVVKSNLVTFTQQAAATEPYIMVNTTEWNVDANGGSKTFGFDYENLGDNPTFEVAFFDQTGETEIECGWISYEFVGDKVTITASNNDESSARTAYFKVYAEVNKTAIYSNLVTINQEGYVAPVPATTYSLATSITAGKHYLIVGYNSKNNIYQAMGVQNDNNRAAVDVPTDNEGKISITNEEVKEAVFYGPDASGLYTIYDAETPGCLYAASSSANQMKTQETNNENGKWTIEFDNDKASIVATESSNRNVMQYNSGSTLFSCYATASQSPIYLYEKDEDTPIATTESVTLNAYGYATFATTSALDFLDAENADFSAWQISDVSKTTGTITFTQITSHVIAGEGILLKGNANATIDLNILPAGGGAELSENLLFGVTEPKAVTTGDHYGLKGNTFVPVNPGTVPAGKALLPASFVSANVKAYTFIFNDADGIQTVQTVSAEEAQTIFNLAGQRLPKAQKGINIINGKKVLIK